MSETKKLNPTSLVYTDTAPVVTKTLSRSFGGIDYEQDFQRNEAKTLENCVAIATAIAAKESTETEKVDPETVLSRMFNSSLDLLVRAKLAPALEAAVEGPAKIIEKAAKAMATAFGISIDEAREQVKKQRVDRGLSV